MESVFETKEQFLKMREVWKKCATDKEMRKGFTKENMALYQALRKRDWRKAFASTSSEQTIYEIERFLFDWKPEFMDLWPFKEFVTQDMVVKLRSSGILKRWDEV